MIFKRRYPKMQNLRKGLEILKLLPARCRKTCVRCGFDPFFLVSSIHQQSLFTLFSTRAMLS